MATKEQLDKLDAMAKPRSNKAIASADERKKQRSKLFLGDNSSVEKKYKLTDETIGISGNITLHRIKALRNFGDVKKGDIGGFVESHENLSHDGDCWIYEDAKVFGNASVSGDAKVYGNASVYEHAIVYGHAQVGDNALVCDKAEVHGNAHVYGNAKICWNAMVYENAHVYGNARVCQDAQVHGNACVYGISHVYGYARIFGDAEISDMQDYLVFKNWWSSGRYFTWTRSDDMWTCGCFHGTGKELIEKAYLDSELSGREYEHVVNYVEGVKERMNKK